MKRKKKVILDVEDDLSREYMLVRYTSEVK